MNTGAEVRANQYTRTNLPVNREVALKKGDDLMAEIFQIESRLDYNDPDIFPTIDDYDLWRKRAMSALGFKKQELSFLQNFIKVLDGKVSEIKVLPEKIKIFEILYTENHLPKGIENAQERETCLNELFDVCIWTLSDLKSLIIINRNNQDLIIKYRSFIDEVKQKMGHIAQERFTINRFIRVQESKKECLKIITRAVQNGFVLTAREKEFYDDFLEQVNR